MTLNDLIRWAMRQETQVSLNTPVFVKFDAETGKEEMFCQWTGNGTPIDPLPLS